MGQAADRRTMTLNGLAIVGHNWVSYALRVVRKRSLKLAKVISLAFLLHALSSCSSRQLYFLSIVIYCILIVNKGYALATKSV